MTNIYVAGVFDDQASWDDLISRLTWYFAPYLDKIDRIELCASAEQIAAAALIGPLDPKITTHMPALKAKLKPVSEAMLRHRLGTVNGKTHLFLLADDGMLDDFKSEIGRFRPHGRFYRIDPKQSRMEGSLFLWAGVNAFCDTKAVTATYQARFLEMAKEIGQFDKSYVFGTGPSLSDFVEGHDFDGSLTIIANSIVMNHDMLDKLKPKLIVAADPIFHAGCSSYAAAFRDALEVAMDKTGAWFLCPLRDVNIYAQYLPQKFQDRIIGIPFDAKAPPPTDLTRTFALHPYPNVLTLMLLPLASTFAREVHIGGCDGRPVTENRSFWSHDKKAQFVDEMDNIKKVHPGFFAIDYNNYYFEHARELEGVLGTLEAAGKRCVNQCRSFIPALNMREAPGLRPASDLPDRPFDAQTLAILDPDARGDWGHFLAYDRRLAIAAGEHGLSFSVIGREDLPQSARPAEVRSLINAFSRHSWTIGNKWPDTKTEDLTAFAFEVEAALCRLEEEVPEGDILIFMYCGGLEVVEMLEHILIYHPRVRAVINLFWSYNFDITDPAYRAQWRALLHRVAQGTGRVRVMHSTPQIADEFHRDWGIDIPVLPHSSTTFSDARAAELARMPARTAPRSQRPRVLFPGGARREKGFLLAAQACGLLADDGTYELLLRARTEDAEPALKRAVAALDPQKVSLVAGDFEQDAFVDWLASADVLVVPYLPEAFSNRTSGMLVDAMLLGIPVVTIKGTWLADELAACGGGISVDPTPGALVAAIGEIVADYARYSAATRAAAAQYLSGSTWYVLTQKVLDCAQSASAGARAPQATAASMRPVPAPVATPMQDATLSGAVPAFQMFCWAAETSEPVVQAGAAAMIPPQPSERALLLYEDPLTLIAEAIAQGGDPGAALQTWEIEALAALGMLRQAHRQVSVVERARFAGAPAEAAALLAQKLPGCKVPVRFDVAAGVNPLLHALADIFLRERPSAVRALAEIRARGLRLSKEAGIERVDAADAVAAWQRLSAYKGLATQRQEDIDTLTARLSHLEQEVESRTRTGRFKDDQLRQLQATVTSFGGEADVLRVQLARKSAELREVKAISDRVHGEAESLMVDLEALRQSTSWKLTRPVRFLRRMLSSRPSNGAGE